MDLPQLFRRAATEFPASTAIDDGVTSRTLAELIARAERLANGLDALGVRAGASVGVLSENRAEYLEADVAIVLARRVRVALNARLGLDDIRYAVLDAGIEVLFHSAAHAEIANALGDELAIPTVSFDAGSDVRLWSEDLIERSSAQRVVRPGTDADAAWITYTSGTTGRPKGVVLSHRALAEVAFNLLLEYGPVGGGELLVCTQALSHASAYFALPYLVSGGGVRVMSRFDPELVWELSGRPDVHTLKLVPAMFPPLLDAARPTGWGYETSIYGAAPIAGPILDEALDRFGPTLMQGYGQSEAPCTLTCLRKQDHLDPVARASAGRPWRSVNLQIRDEHGEEVPAGTVGEVTVAGDLLMTGYHGLPAATADVLKDGWLRTRDLGKIDERGFVHLQGRVDDIINSGGYNVAPAEVEAVLLQHPAVLEAAVLGLPHPRWGAAVAAGVRLRAGAWATAAELDEFARPRLSFRAPKTIVILDEIPRSPYGKVDRLVLRELLVAASTWSRS